MRGYKLTGRQACILSPYHQELHATAYARAKAMHDMVRAGATLDEVGQEFGVSRKAVWHAMRRQGLR